MKEKSSCRNY